MDVRMVIGRVCGFGDTVDELDGGLEARPPERLGERVALAPPAAA